MKNPSFEDLYSCPTPTAYLIDTAIGWSNPINGPGCSPDLYNECAVGTIVGVPINNYGQGFQYGKSGKGYAAILVAVSSQPNNQREYLQSKLLQKLQTGKNYCVTFYANLFNTCLAYIKPLGAYFDNGNVTAPTTCGLAMVTPQVYNTGQPLADTLNWMKIQGSFTATGTETYITLGNFFNNSASDVGLVGNPTSWFSYYFIDDISVIDVGTPAYAGNDTAILNGDSLFIGRTPEIGLNEDCIWFVNGAPIDTIAGLWVKPTNNTTYVLQQTICGSVTYDTVKVYVSAVGINELNKNDNALEIYPNPTSGSFSIFIASEKNINESVLISVSDITGKVITSHTLQVKDNKAVFDTDLGNGIYLISLKDSNGNISTPKKITIIK